VEAAGNSWAAKLRDGTDRCPESHFQGLRGW
jgi:hypothetical protein